MYTFILDQREIFLIVVQMYPDNKQVWHASK